MRYKNYFLEYVSFSKIPEESFLMFFFFFLSLVYASYFSSPYYSLEIFYGVKVGKRGKRKRERHIDSERKREE